MKRRCDIGKGSAKRKAIATFLFLILVIAIISAIILVGEHFTFVFKVINIKGKVNVFLTNDDVGTELVSLLNAKTADVKHIELLGRYTTDGISEDKSQYMDPVKKTMDSAYSYYQFSLNAPRPASFQTGVPTQIQDSTKSAITGCGTTAPDQITLRWPSSSKRVTSGFGGRELNKGMCDCHGGIDIGGEDENVYAAVGGIVVDTYTTCAVGNKNCNHGNGNYVVVEFKVGQNAYRTYYDHLKAISVNVNDEVGYEDDDKRKVIGKSGNTGYSEGAHLHFELRKYPYTPDKDSISTCGMFKDITSVTGNCIHEQVSVCKYVSGIISGAGVRSYETQIPLPGPRSGATLRGTVMFKQWN